MKIKINKFILLFTVLLLLGAFFINRVRIYAIYDGFIKPELPEAREFQGSSFELREEVGVVIEDNMDVDSLFDSDIGTDDKIAEVFVPVLPVEYNLAVPFQPQAPFANWDMPYQEACEEASLIMADAYFAGQALSANDMDYAIKKLQNSEIYGLIGVSI